MFLFGSLFYNINTSSVEDLTGRGSSDFFLRIYAIIFIVHLKIFPILTNRILCSGVQDLRNGYVVTPLPPKATFLDDPLRVLRAIRFGNKFTWIWQLFYSFLRKLYSWWRTWLIRKVFWLCICKFWLDNVLERFI